MVLRIRLVEGEIISGTSDGVGSAVIIANAANTVTFATKVGVAGASGVQFLTLGSGVRGNATFNADVSAVTSDWDSDAGAAIFDFNADYVGTTIVVETGGASGDTANINFAGNVTIVTSMTVDVETGLATVTYDGTAAQTHTGNIIAAADGDGDLVITNTAAAGVTFVDDVGVDCKGLGSLSMPADAKMTIQAPDNDALTFDVVGNVAVTKGSSTKGGELVLAGGNTSASGTAGAALDTSNNNRNDKTYYCNC